MGAGAVQAVILAAGNGIRMRSARAKVLQPLLGAPLLEPVLRAILGVGADPIAIVVGHDADAVEAAFAGRGRFVRQDPPRGTGDAVLAARAVFAAHPERTLLVVNGDLPLLSAETLRRLLAAHAEAGAAATLLAALLADGGDHGRVLRDREGAVRKLVEASDATPAELEAREIDAGAYAFRVAPLLAALARLQPRTAQGEYCLTDAVALLLAAGERVAALPAADAEEALDVNTPEQLAELARRVRDRKLRELLASGVTLEDPATTWIAPSVEVAPDATIRAFTLLEGRTIVRAGASVGPFARLTDVELGAGARVLDHCLLRQCAVGPGASVGPFAHLRPESRVGSGARVGNFVELKKTRLGDGSKAPHLSYLGDAEIGPGVNVGAGTITCNYDGAAKHLTRIEAGAFVGSDATLVAPVTIGEGAYVAAGSTITEDVPAHALALGRARQVVKPGWARRRREARPRDKAPR